MKLYKIFYLIPIIVGLASVAILIFPGIVTVFPFIDDTFVISGGVIALVGGPICFAIAWYRRESDVMTAYQIWPFVMFIYGALVYYSLTHLFGS
jgi:hypothetical protein